MTRIRITAALLVLALPLAGCGRDEVKEKALAEQAAAAEARADAAERHAKELSNALEKLRAPPSMDTPSMTMSTPGEGLALGEGTGDAPMNTQLPADPQGSNVGASGPSDNSGPPAQG